MNEDSHILAGCNGETCCVSVHGKATAHHCAALRAFVLEALDRGARRVQVDLANCQYGDSTFLGTLLQFRKACQRLGPSSLTLHAPTCEFRQTLRTMGLLRLFDLADDAALPEGIRWGRLPCEEPGRCSFDFQQNVAVAHRLLAESSEAGRDRYALIAEAAERELARRMPTA
jgi:anti-anti-sigma factor